MADLQAILGPDGKPYYVTSRHPIGGEHVSALARWNKQARARFLEEHAPGGRHTAPRFCKGVIAFRVHGKDQDLVSIDRASVWFEKDQGAGAGYSASVVKLPTQFGTLWTVTIDLPEGYSYTPILSLGSGGRWVDTSLGLSSKTQLVFTATAYDGRPGWGMRANILLFGSKVP